METLKFAFYIAGTLFFIGMIIFFIVMAFFGNNEDTNVERTLCRDIPPPKKKYDFKYIPLENVDCYIEQIKAIERRCKKLELYYECEKAEKELSKEKLQEQEKETAYYKEKYEELANKHTVIIEECTSNDNAEKISKLSDKKYYYRVTDYENTLFATEYDKARDFIGEKSGKITQYEFNITYEGAELLAYELIEKGVITFTNITKQSK